MMDLNHFRQLAGLPSVLTEGTVKLINPNKFTDEPETLLSGLDRVDLEDTDLDSFLDSKTKSITYDISKLVHKVSEKGEFHYEFKVWHYSGKTFWYMSGESQNIGLLAVKGIFSPQDVAYSYFNDLLQDFNKDEEEFWAISFIAYVIKQGWI